MDQNFQPDFSNEDPFEPASPSQQLPEVQPAEPLPMPEIIEPASSQPKKSNTGLIVVIVLLVILCCCCILVAITIYIVLYGAYWLGDVILDVINQILPGLFG